MKMKILYCFIAFVLISTKTFSQVLDSTIIVTGSASAPLLYELKKTEDLYVKGQIDAERNYVKYKGAAAGTLITSLVSPLVGLIPAIACSSTPPKITNLGYPDEKLFQEKDYHNGYTAKAKKIKKRKVWANWGIGFGVNILLALILSSGA